MTDNRLLLIVERIERLLEERRGISDDIRDVYAEAKAVGYSASTIRALIKRRAMKPDDRAESDALLQTYEAALGMDGDRAEGAIRTVSPDAVEVATLLLAEQVEGLNDPDRAALIVGHVLFLLDLRAEIALLRKDEAARKAEAKAQRFDAKQLHQVVRWFEKVAKHGLEAMRLGEETFRLYRGTLDDHAGRAAVEGATSDPKLAALLTAPAPDKAPNKRIKTLSAARAAAALARRANNGEI